MRAIHILGLGLVLGADAATPNIIFIYTDDMGWTGTSVEMIKGNPKSKSDFYRTPNLGKLAGKGMVFSQAYSPGSLCTPSRASVLTGKTPAELHITTPGGGRSDNSRLLTTPQIAQGLPADVPTIGTLLKEAGYATALLGKWHIGRNSNAGEHGFDVHDGATDNNPNSAPEDPKEIFSITERAVEFIQKHHTAGSPFYLQLSHYAVHSPVETRPESLAKFKKLPSGGLHIETDYAGMTWDLDESIGLIFLAVERLKIADNTYIVFMSDNGAGGNRRLPNNTPLNAGKGSLYEGGIRVPLIIVGPGIQAGYCHTAVTGTDLLATFAQWADVTDIGTNESVSLQPLLKKDEKKFERPKPLLFHYPHYGQGPQQKPQSAIISNHWKLLKDWETGSYHLFNLTEDLGEKEDRSKSNPDKLQEMVSLLDLRLKMTDAQLPSPNPDYDPDAVPQRGKRSSRKRN